jgi:hypothetical protein
MPVDLATEYSVVKRVVKAHLFERRDAVVVDRPHSSVVL